MRNCNNIYSCIILVQHNLSGYVANCGLIQQGEDNAFHFYLNALLNDVLKLCAVFTETTP